MHTHNLNYKIILPYFKSDFTLLFVSMILSIFLICFNNGTSPAYPEVPPTVGWPTDGLGDGVVAFSSWGGPSILILAK